MSQFGRQIVNTDTMGKFFTGLKDNFVNFFSCFFDNFFNSFRLDTSIFNKSFQRHTGNFTTDGVKRREFNNFFFLKVNVNSGCDLESSDVTTFFSDDPTLIILTWKINDR